MSKLQDFKKLVIANAVDVRGLKIGESAPDFVLLNAFGNPFHFQKT